MNGTEREQLCADLRAVCEDRAALDALVQRVRGVPLARIARDPRVDAKSQRDIEHLVQAVVSDAALRGWEQALRQEVDRLLEEQRQRQQGPAP